LFSHNASLTKNVLDSNTQIPMQEYRLSAEEAEWIAGGKSLKSEFEAKSLDWDPATLILVRAGKSGSDSNGGQLRTQTFGQDKLG
jgi:hypothetical protein